MGFGAGQGHQPSSSLFVKFARRVSSSGVKFCQVQSLTTQPNAVRRQGLGSRQGRPRPIAARDAVLRPGRNWTRGAAVAPDWRGGGGKERTRIGPLSFGLAAGHKKSLPQILIIRKSLLRPERKRSAVAAGRPRQPIAGHALCRDCASSMRRPGVWPNWFGDGPDILAGARDRFGGFVSRRRKLAILPYAHSAGRLGASTDSTGSLR